jgi:hypothetical protein
VEGAGNLSLTSFVNSSSVPQAQQPLPLSSPGTKDLELPINILGERVAFQASTGQAGAWFRLEKFTPSVRVDPWAGSRSELIFGGPHRVCLMRLQQPSEKFLTYANCCSTGCWLRHKDCY